MSKPRQPELHCIPLPRNRKEKEKVTTCANMQTPLTLSLFMGAPSADTFNSSTSPNTKAKVDAFLHTVSFILEERPRATQRTHILMHSIFKSHVIADDSISALNSARLNAYRTAFTIHRDSIKCPVCIRWSRI